jgi:DNA-binding transcriptional regulator YiaG
MKRNPFAQSLVDFRTRYSLTQSQCAALIPHFSVRMLQKYEQAASEPPVWVQLLLIDALLKNVKMIK